MGVNKLLIGCIAPFFVSCGDPRIWDSDVMLIGGSVVNIPQVVELSPVGCTGTVVGPKMMLTAGHCYATNSSVKFNYRGVQYSGKCQRNPKYNDRDATNDHSLCVMTSDMPGPYAFVDTVPVFLGENLRLMGYGCTKVGFFGGGSGADGKLREGSAPVKQIYSKEFKTIGASQLCYGDSGGPVMRSGLKVVGVNSKRETSNKTTSYLARLDHNDFLEFAKSVIAAQLTPVCGILAASECSTQRQLAE